MFGSKISDLVLAFVPRFWMKQFLEDFPQGTMHFKFTLKEIALDSMFECHLICRDCQIRDKIVLRVASIVCRL